MCVLPMSVLTVVAVVICPAAWCEENTAQVVAQLQQQVSALLQQVQVLKENDKLLIEARRQDREEIQALKKYLHQLPVTLPTAEKDNRRQIYPGTGVGFTACVGVQDLHALGASQTIVFDRVTTNEGGAYHPTTGIFTAPSDGLYVFHFSAMIRPNKSMYFVIVQDGTYIDDFYIDSRGDNGEESTSEMWVLKLAAGNEVWIKAKSTGEVHGNCHTMFSGFQLYTTEG